jgi:hypothetical protein
VADEDHEAVDYRKLVGLDTPEPKADEPSPKPEAKEPAPEPKEEELEPAPKAKEEDDPPSKALTKMQQRQTTLERQQADERKRLDEKLDRQNARLEKMAKALGIEEETPQPAAVVDDAALAQYRKTQEKIAKLEREVEFSKIQRRFPDSDPEAMQRDAINEALELHDIDPDAPLPEGTDTAAIERVAAKLFQKKVEALATKPPAKEPPPPLPPKAGKGGKVSASPASHIPAPGAKAPEKESFKEECLRLTGQVED